MALGEEVQKQGSTLGSTSGKVYGSASALPWPLPFPFGSMPARGAGSAHVLKGGMALVRALVHLCHVGMHAVTQDTLLVFSSLQGVVLQSLILLLAHFQSTRTACTLMVCAWVSAAAWAWHGQPPPLPRQAVHGHHLHLQPVRPCQNLPAALQASPAAASCPCPSCLPQRPAPFAHVGDHYPPATGFAVFTGSTDLSYVL